MREWKKPEMWVLDAKYTAAGGNGGADDGVIYNVNTQEYGTVNLYGSSGPALGSN